MRIGEVGRRSGVNPTTIRYYEHIGLLPAPERTPSGYRDYAEDTVARLAFIRAARRIGLTLGEIREIFRLRDRGEAPCAHVITVLEHRAAELEQTIRTLGEMRSELVALAQQARRLPARADATVCHIIETSQRA